MGNIYDAVRAKEEELRQHEAQLKLTEMRLNAAEETLQLHTNALEILKDTAIELQQLVVGSLSEIVTNAVQYVIGKDYRFVAEFVERRGTSECDMYLEYNGHRRDILGSTGGGVADVCSFALKVAYLLLSPNERCLILDEVSRHINDVGQRERFAETVLELCRKFDMQIILLTGVDELVEIADKVITLEFVDDHTEVKDVVSNYQA